MEINLYSLLTYFCQNTLPSALSDCTNSFLRSYVARYISRLGDLGSFAAS